jgi:hypothetical protein
MAKKSVPGQMTHSVGKSGGQAGRKSLQTHQGLHENMPHGKMTTPKRAGVRRAVSVS